MGSLGEWATVVASVALVVVVVLQVRRASRDVLVQVAAAKEAVGRQINDARQLAQADHDRRKKQSTLEFYRLVMTDNEANRDLITNVHGTEPIEKTVAEKYHKAATASGGLGEDHQMGSAIRAYLNGLERLAVGANLEIFDLQVLEVLAKYRFVSALKQFEHYIEVASATHQTKNIYREFRGVAHSWASPDSGVGPAETVRRIQSD